MHQGMLSTLLSLLNFSSMVQVQLSSSNSGRCTVSDLWHDIKQELDGAGITLDPEQKPKLLQLCLQCNERSPEELGRREVCPPAYKLSLQTAMWTIHVHTMPLATLHVFRLQDLNLSPKSCYCSHIYLSSAVPPSTSAVTLYNCEQVNASKTYAMQELDMSSTLADLLSHNDKDAVTRAFHAHDLGEDGPSNTEARIWVATLAVAARAVPEVTDATNDSLDSVNVQQCDDDSAQYQLPTVSASQSAVANEIILRILLSKGENKVGVETVQKVLSTCAAEGLGYCACLHSHHSCPSSCTML